MSRVFVVLREATNFRALESNCPPPPAPPPHTRTHQKKTILSESEFSFAMDCSVGVVSLPKEEG